MKRKKPKHSFDRGIYKVTSMSGGYLHAMICAVEDLTDRAGLHRTYISHIENAKREISVETMCKIAKGFDIDSSTLIENISF